MTARISAKQYNALYGSLPKPRRASKYGNHKVKLDGVTFDSIGEMNHFAKLSLMEMAGEISDLKRQVSFQLVPPIRLAGEDRAASIKYVADFVYRDKDGKQIIQDFKGMDNAVSRIKRRLMKHVLGLDVQIVRAK